MSQHRNTVSLPLLDPPLGPKEHVEIYLAVAGERKPDRSPHSIGLVFVAEGRNIIPFNAIGDHEYSDTARGDLAALLTALEWVNKNAKAAGGCNIYSRAEYIFKHLPMNISNWVKDRSRPNHDLLSLIKIQLDLLSNVRILRCPDDPISEGYRSEAVNCAKKALEGTTLEAERLAY